MLFKKLRFLSSIIKLVEAESSPSNMSAFTLETWMLVFAWIPCIIREDECFGLSDDEPFSG